MVILAMLKPLASFNTLLSAHGRHLAWGAMG